MKKLKLECRLARMAARGNTPASCGPMRKVIRQLRNLKEDN